MQENHDFQEFFRKIGVSEVFLQSRQSTEERIELFRKFLPFFSAEKQRKIEKALQLAMMLPEKAPEDSARQMKGSG